MRCRTDTLSLRVVTPGEPALQLLLVTQATSLNLAEEAFGNVFSAHDPLAWVLLSSEVTIHEGVSPGLLRGSFTPEAIEHFEVQAAAGYSMAFAWEYDCWWLGVWSERGGSRRLPRDQMTLKADAEAEAFGQSGLDNL